MWRALFRKFKWRNLCWVQETLNVPVWVGVWKERQRGKKGAEGWSHWAAETLFHVKCQEFFFLTYTNMSIEMQNRYSEQYFFLTYYGKKGTSEFQFWPDIKLKLKWGISLVVQWLRLHAPNTGSPGLIPGWGTKIPRATRKSIRAATKTQHSWVSKYVLKMKSVILTYNFQFTVRIFTHAKPGPHHLLLTIH